MPDRIFENICAQLDLGRLLLPPVRLSGGLMHNMFSLETTRGRYAVKLLNPHVMLRPEAKANFDTAERLEEILEKYGIPILPALTFQHKKMQELDGQYFYLFPWYDGRALKSGGIKEFHCAEGGRILALIHKIDKREAPFVRNEIRIDWDFYIRGLEAENSGLFQLLKDNRSLLCDCQERGNAAVKRLPQVAAICHNDMDCKNILWNDRDYRIIDLECLSYSNPFLELMELALCWSGYEERAVDFELLRVFVRSYLAAGGSAPVDWEAVYDSNCGRLEWLEYNIKRVLGIDCGADEKEPGISEVRKTVEQIVYYADRKAAVLDSLSQSD